MSLGSVKKRRNAPSRDFTALTYVDGLDLPLLEKKLPLGLPYGYHLCVPEGSQGGIVDQTNGKEVKVEYNRGANDHIILVVQAE